MSKRQRFFSDLFDLSFSKYITPRILGLLYILGIIFSGLYALTFLFLGFSAIISGETLAGVLALISAPLVFLLYVIFIRVTLEPMIIGFRIEQNTARTADNTESLRQP